MLGPRLVARLLGTPAFSWAGVPVAPRAVKALAVLAYLTRAEHGVARRDLAELLWAPGRVGSVHQALHTLRATPGGEQWLSVGRGPVRLRARCDVTVFARLVARGRYATALALWRGTPFDGVRVPDAPAFEDWLALERMRLDDLRRDALRGESQRLALAGASTEAIGLAATLLQLDPLDENAHQTVVRLQLQRGDVRSARLQFEACRALLDRELGVDPLPETTELGDAIAAAERAIRQHTPLATIGAVPPALLRPRVLVGRSAELAAVSRAWSEGRIVLLVEAAGAGTSRLALDAAEGRGRYLVLEGRPGDAGVPYASLVRVAATLLQAADDAVLPEWARAELTRVAADPAAVDGTSDSGPIVSARVGPAVGAALRALGPAVATVVIDDLHAFDEDSRRVILAALGEDGTHRPALAVTARDGALPAADAGSLDALCAKGMALVIDLPPLGAGAIETLLASVGIEDGQALAGDLVRFTGGNPLFVVEVLKDLHAAGRLRSAAGLPADVGAPDRVVRTLERRLDDLDREALRAVRVLALAPDAVGDLVAEVLELDEHRVAEALGAAERAGLLVDGGFTHGLAQEVVQAHAPASVRRLLHRRLADALADRGAPVGVVAWHRLEAADDDAAAPVVQAAAEAALRIGPSRQAMRWLERLVDRVDDTSERHARALLWLGAARGKIELDRGQREVEAALDAADRHGHAAIALDALITLARQARTAGAYARSAALLDDAAHRAGHPTPVKITIDRHWVTFHLAWARGDFVAAEASLEALAPLVPDDADLAYERSTLDWHMGRLQRCARRLAGIDRAGVDASTGAHVDHMAGLAAWALGWPSQAEQFLRHALTTFEALGDVQHEVLVRNGVALALLGAGRFDESHDHALRAGRLVHAHGTPLFAADAASRRALIALHCDEADDALRALQEAWDAVEGVIDPYRQSTILSVWAGASAAVGDVEGAVATATEALELAERIGQPLACAIAERARSVADRYAGDPKGAAEHAERSARRAARHGMVEQQGHALVMQARAYEAADRAAARDLAVEARTLGRDRMLPHLAWLAGSVLVRSGDDAAVAEVDHLEARLRARSISGRLLEL